MPRSTQRWMIDLVRMFRLMCEHLYQTNRQGIRPTGDPHLIARRWAVPAPRHTATAAAATPGKRTSRWSTYLQPGLSSVMYLTVCLTA